VIVQGCVPCVSFWKECERSSHGGRGGSCNFRSFVVGRHSPHPTSRPTQCCTFPPTLPRLWVAAATTTLERRTLSSFALYVVRSAPPQRRRRWRRRASPPRLPLRAFFLATGRRLQSAATVAAGGASLKGPANTIGKSEKTRSSSGRLRRRRVHISAVGVATRVLAGARSRRREAGRANFRSPQCRERVRFQRRQ